MQYLSDAVEAESNTNDHSIDDSSIDIEDLDVIDKWSAGRNEEMEDEEMEEVIDISDDEDDIITISDDDDSADMRSQPPTVGDDAAMVRDQPTTVGTETTAVQGRVPAEGDVTTAARNRPSTSTSVDTSMPNQLTATDRVTTAVRDGERRRLPCEFCSKTFTRIDNLNVHKRKCCNGLRSGNRQGNSAQVTSRSDQSVNNAGPSHTSNNLDRTSPVASPRPHFICPICRFDARSQFYLALHSLSHTDHGDIIRDQGANIRLEPIRSFGSPRDYEVQ